MGNGLVGPLIIRCLSLEAAPCVVGKVSDSTGAGLEVRRAVNEVMVMKTGPALSRNDRYNRLNFIPFHAYFAFKFIKFLLADKKMILSKSGRWGPPKMGAG